MPIAILALADKTPNEQAVALSPTVGWLMLLAVTLAALVFILHADKWRRWWLTAEDPRGIAVFRIVFTFFVISNINGMWEFFEYLYTDEGIFTTDVARQVFAREQFAGFGDGLREDDPWGFYDLGAFLQFMKGPKYSLLFFWDSPTFFWAHLWAFELSAFLFLIGFRTRLFGVLTWFLMNSILVRNHLAWEGTEIVYRVMLVYLVMARSGHAYSVDNWLRCRRLRRQGRLSERGGPGGGAGLAPDEQHPEGPSDAEGVRSPRAANNGLEPVYRLIPSWPRKLIMLQLAVIYIVTGLLKNGSVWLSGDSLYYALNLDHFYRLPPQYMSSLIGTHVFRGMTWAVKIGQIAFAAIMFGIVARWIIAEKLPPLSRGRQWAARVAFAGLILATAAIIHVTYPVHFTPPVSAELFAGLWVALWAGLWLLWRKLTYRPFVVRRVFGRTLREPAIIDRTWVCRWILGRRVLLVWHLAFHAHIFTLMNVGQFQTGMLACTFAFLQGHEIATMMRDVGHRLAKTFPRTLGRLLPRAVVERQPILPAADPTLPRWHREVSVLPQWALLLGLGGIVSGILVQVRWQPEWDYRLVWLGTAVGVAAIAIVRARRLRGHREPAVDPGSGQLRAPWAYGPFGRLLVGGLLVWHITAVAAWLLPDKDCVSSFRRPAHEAVGTWLRATTTDQGWGMFAPNPPRQNVFMKVLVTDADGHVWDLKTDVYAEERKPIPWIWNTRLRKMNRRIIGGESGPTAWYQKWYARYECRQWAREHGGRMPQKVELVKVWYGIPSPEQTAKNGYYVAEDLLERSGHEKVSYTAKCRTEVQGQLPNFIRERDGLPLLPPGEYRAWHKRKRAAWEKRKERREAERARAAAEQAKQG